MENLVKPYAEVAESSDTPEGNPVLPHMMFCRPGWSPANTQASGENEMELATAARDNQGNKHREKRVKKRKDIARCELDAKLKDNRAIEQCVAHIECSVESLRELDRQVLLYAMIDRYGAPWPFDSATLVLTRLLARVWVQSEYWTGKTFIHTRDDVPPYLAYLGEGRFAYRVRRRQGSQPDAVPAGQQAV